MIEVQLNLPENVQSYEDLQAHLWDRYHLDVDIDSESDYFMDLFYNHDLRSWCGWVEDFETLRIVGELPNDS